MIPSRATASTRGLALLLTKGCQGQGADTSRRREWLDMERNETQSLGWSTNLDVLAEGIQPRVCSDVRGHGDREQRVN